MRLLLIDCYTQPSAKKIASYQSMLQQSAADLGVNLTIEVVAASCPPANGFDAVLLSGSQRMVGQGEYEPGLIEFLHRNRRPLLGICYGHQLLAVAFGGRVVRDQRQHKGDEIVRQLAEHALFSGLQNPSAMSQSHWEVVVRDPQLWEHFFLLAENDEGGIEALAHRHWPFLGVQFHPERSAASGRILLGNFLRWTKQFLP